MFTARGCEVPRLTSLRPKKPTSARTKSALSPDALINWLKDNIKDQTFFTSVSIGWAGDLCDGEIKNILAVNWHETTGQPLEMLELLAKAGVRGGEYPFAESRDGSLSVNTAGMVRFNFDRWNFHGLGLESSSAGNSEIKVDLNLLSTRARVNPLLNDREIVSNKCLQRIYECMSSERLPGEITLLSCQPLGQKEETQRSKIPEKRQWKIGDANHSVQYMSGIDVFDARRHTCPKPCIQKVDSEGSEEKLAELAGRILSGLPLDPVNFEEILVQNDGDSEAFYSICCMRDVFVELRSYLIPILKAFLLHSEIEKKADQIMMVNFSNELPEKGESLLLVVTKEGESGNCRANLLKFDPISR